MAERDRSLSICLRCTKNQNIGHDCMATEIITPSQLHGIRDNDLGITTRGLFYRRGALLAYRTDWDSVPRELDKRSDDQQFWLRPYHACMTLQNIPEISHTGVPRQVSSVGVHTPPRGPVPITPFIICNSIIFIRPQHADTTGWFWARDLIVPNRVYL